MASPLVRLSRFDLPGLNLPLNFTPHKAHVKWSYSSGQPGGTRISVPATGEEKDLFPSALSNIKADLPLTTLREFTMLQFMNHLTDKPGWEAKVFDETIVAKWKAETLASKSHDVSQAMFDWIIAELRYKADIFKEAGAVTVYNGDVVKSDSKVPESLKKALKSAVKPLEAIPEVYRDYHPESDGKVIDLVHPSLFPLIYGRSRILPDRLIGINDCLENTGLGHRIPPPSEIDAKSGAGKESSSAWSRPAAPYSRNYQWLPCEVKFIGQGENVKITSYINNLHPRKHQELYVIIEQIISHAVPLWNMTLTPFNDPGFRISRIEYPKPMYDPDPETMPADMKPQQGPDEDDDDYDERIWEWAEEFRREHIVQPEPGTFALPEKTINKDTAQAVDLKRDYGHRGLQVIVKLATISLTPEKPSYDGGSWHIEGQLNEHICATALYYYDSENITESRLAFRQQSNEEDTHDIGYEQGDNVWSGPVFGIENEESCVQDVGDIVCKEGRLVTFPNILQHRVGPFELEDQSRPGHRKLVALFLVDPNIRIISTANVPPQQRDWWSEELKSGGVFDKLAPELQDKVFEGVDDFPIGLDEAKELRLKLMDERKDFVIMQNRGFEAVSISLCEH